MCCILDIEDQPRWPLSLPCYRYFFIEDSLGAVNQLAATSASSLNLHQLVIIPIMELITDNFSDGVHHPEAIT
jgi:hypothetical protein